jgi:hypothetical protein
LVPLGVIDPTKYEYITADAAVSLTSTDLFGVAVADSVVPEPSTWIMGGTAVLAGLGYARLRYTRLCRKRAAA